MNGEVKFSVVVPYYNREKYLKDCLTSIKNQKYINFEVICIDDGSTDKSLEIVEDFGKVDTRFKSFRNDENRGISYSREKGKNLATGDFLIFIDSDDIVTSDHLINVYNMICKYPDIDLIKIPINNNIEKLQNSFIKSLGRDIFNLFDSDIEKIYYKNDFNILGYTVSFVRRLDIIRDIHFNIDNALGKELLFPEIIFNLESLLNSKKIGLLRKRTYEVQVSENSTRQMDKSLDKCLQSFNIHLKRLQEIHKKEKIPKYIIDRLYTSFKYLNIPTKNLDILKNLEVLRI